MLGQLPWYVQNTLDMPVHRYNCVEQDQASVLLDAHHAAMGFPSAEWSLQGSAGDADTEHTVLFCTTCSCARNVSP